MARSISGDDSGLSRARAAEHDNQHEGRTGAKGPVKSGTRGTGRVKGNGTDGGGINRATRSTPQN